jgi:hypothetical protein
MKKLALSIASTLLFSLLIFSSCNNPSTPKEPVTKSEMKTDSVKKDTVHSKAYVCPMGPQCGEGDTAGKCASCGMELKQNPAFKGK